MIAGGSCITRIDGKAVFVPFSLPGETVEIEITDSRKDYSFARLVSVVKPSPHRIAPACPLFGICGGCTLQMADNAYQSELRLSILHDVFSRAHIEPAEGISVESGAPMEYRSRLQFHRTREGGIGFNEAATNRVIAIPDCPVAVCEIREALQNGTLAKSARHFNSGDRFHVFAYNGTLWHEDGDTDCCIDISGIPVRFDVRGFFQSNIPMLERILAAVSRAAVSRAAVSRAAVSRAAGYGSDDKPLSGERLLDFYSGVGTFSVFAGKNFRETVLVEHNREALTLAEINLAGRDRAPVLCAVSDERWASHPASRLTYDVAIIDPPRQGLHKFTLEWFASSCIPDIRYVSCDPVTFARDAFKLIAAGYTLKKVILFDFYPQTHHIETLGFFER